MLYEFRKRVRKRVSPSQFLPVYNLIFTKLTSSSGTLPPRRLLHKGGDKN